MAETCEELLRIWKNKSREEREEESEFKRVTREGERNLSPPNLVFGLKKETSPFSQQLAPAPIHNTQFAFFSTYSSSLSQSIKERMNKKRVTKFFVSFPLRSSREGGKRRLKA